MERDRPAPEWANQQELQRIKKDRALVQIIHKLRSLQQHDMYVDETTSRVVVGFIDVLDGSYGIFQEDTSQKDPVELDKASVQDIRLRSSVIEHARDVIADQAKARHIAGLPPVDANLLLDFLQVQEGYHAELRAWYADRDVDSLDCDNLEGFPQARDPHEMQRLTQNLREKLQSKGYRQINPVDRERITRGKTLLHYSQSESKVKGQRKSSDEGVYITSKSKGPQAEVYARKTDQETDQGIHYVIVGGGVLDEVKGYGNVSVTTHNVDIKVVSADSTLKNGSITVKNGHIGILDMESGKARVEEGMVFLVKANGIGVSVDTEESDVMQIHAFNDGVVKIADGNVGRVDINDNGDVKVQGDVLKASNTGRDSRLFVQGNVGSYKGSYASWGIVAGHVANKSLDHMGLLSVVDLDAQTVRHTLDMAEGVRLAASPDIEAGGNDIAKIYLANLLTGLIDGSVNHDRLREIEDQVKALLSIPGINSDVIEADRRAIFLLGILIQKERAQGKQT